MLLLSPIAMKLFTQFFSSFGRLDTRINWWLVKYSIPLLRISMGLVFFGFGILKFFPSISPIEVLATRTTVVLTHGIAAGHKAMDLIATLECLIGLCFLTGRFLRVGVLLMAVQMLGAMSPLLLFPRELFHGPFHAPTLAAQYIIKDIILIAAGMVIAATWTGAKIIAKPTPMLVRLRQKSSRIVGGSLTLAPAQPHQKAV